MAVKQAIESMKAAVLDALDKNAEVIGAAYAGSEAGGGATAGAVALDAGRGALKSMGPIGENIEKGFKVLEWGARVMNSAQEQAAKNMRHFAAVTGDIVQNDLMGAKEKQLRKRLEENNAIGPIGWIRNWWEETRKKLGAVESFREIRQAVGSQAQQIGQFNPLTAAASARAHAGQIQANVREANRLGGSLASAVTAESNWKLAIQAAVTPLKDDLYKQLSAMFESGRIDMEEFTKKFEALRDDTKFLELIKDNSDTAKAFQVTVMKEMKRIRESMEKTGDVTAGNVLQKLLDGTKLLPDDRLGDPFKAPDWAQQAMIHPLLHFA